MADLAALVRQIENDELLDVLGEDRARPFVSAALTPFALSVALQRFASRRAAIVVAADDVAARELAGDLSVFLGDRDVRTYPARGVMYESHLTPPPHLVGLRIAALDALTADGSDAVVVASAGALAERVPDPSLRPHGFTLELSDLADLDELAQDLIDSGYVRVDRVDDRGQFAVRGDILDVFPATADNAARIELFDVEIESIRRFSTFTQRSLEDLKQVEIEPATELAAKHRELASEALAQTEDDEHPADIAELLPLEQFHAVLDLAPDGTWLAVAGVEEVGTTLEELWADIEATYHDPTGHGLYVPTEDLIEAIEDRADLAVSNLAAGADAPQLRAEHPGSTARSFDAAEIEIEKLLRSGYRTVIAWSRQSELERATYNLARVKPRPADELDSTSEWAGVFFEQSALREGFVWPALKLAVIPDRLLLRTSGQNAASRAGAGGRARIATFADLAVGDIVVHEDHGIARFDGFETKTVANVTRDYLTLAYRGDDRVFLPADQLHKISRYFGAAGPDGISLSKLGGKTWENIKSRARKAAHELAGELINLYAERRRAIGFQFSPDTEMQLQFESSFPYQETRDQLDAIERVKEAMEAPQPMDILICGDVGFGKTEVALRAAFKAVQDSKQVLLLAPTTILTQQHFGTFSERVRDYPVSVDFVSRFRSKAQQKESLEKFAAGETDILIGTHRLLSPDVRPKDLGLIIVDEEQRFGVKQKELLRQLKLRTDVISLSATPIPRTLQMTMAGMREIAVIATPPEGRKPVRTHVGEWDEEVVKQALLREHDREGQSIYMHDLVGTIDVAADRIRALLPQLKVEVVHGQLDETTLEERMLGFIRGEYDCLVCTTIVESGLDIPAANTLVVERADKLGLAQAYQIRGRVGRGRERAFAYFLYPGAAALTQVAGSRLATLADHTDLGSGFKVALRDLEIRGAGNLLGDEQSGHIAAIGFDLYVSMIDAAVAELEGKDADAAPEPVRLDVSVDAYVPSDYVMYEQAKIELHRRIAGARELADIGALREELIDRFGPVPDPLQRLLQLQEARLKFGRCGARTVGFTGGRLVVAPIDLSADQMAQVREDLPTAIYDRGQRTIALRVDGEPAEQFDALAGLADTLTAATGHQAAAA